MTDLNLLPKKHRMELKRRIFTRMLYIITVFSFFWIFIFGTMIFAGIRFLSIQNNALEERIATTQNMREAEEVKEIEASIVDLNSLVTRIGQIEEDSSMEGPVILGKIARSTPAGIAVSRIAYNSKTSVVLVNGHADQRTQVITFKERLEADPAFLEVESPLSNLLQSTDVDFKFTITLEGKDENE